MRCGLILRSRRRSCEGRRGRGLNLSSDDCFRYRQIKRERVSLRCSTLYTQQDRDGLDGIGAETREADGIVKSLQPGQLRHIGDNMDRMFIFAYDCQEVVFIKSDWEFKNC